MKVLFLHLPKTAGQSVHQFLIDQFTQELVCPARVNEQYNELSDAELDGYQVFSGHVDWSRFDDIDGPYFTFTILRDPLERLLSFYFYLREQADIFEQRGVLDSMPGVKAAKQNTPYEFFVCRNNPHRAFIDQTLDNLYTYYFSGREYAARGKLKGLVGSRKTFKSSESLVDIALLNMQRGLNGIYGISEWEHRLRQDISSFTDCSTSVADVDYRVNLGKTDGSKRLNMLRELGGTDEVIHTVQSMCEMDYLLLERLKLAV